MKASTIIIYRSVLLYFTCILSCPPLTAQEKRSSILSDKADLIRAETLRYRGLRRIEAAKSLASQWLDVTYYKLNLKINAAAPLLTGEVTVQGICTQGAPQFLELDLTNTMHVDSVKVGGAAAVFRQQPSSITITLDSSYQSGQFIRVDLFYRGTPVASGLGSFVFGAHSGRPWVWSLSEPYGARDWWPCKDQPNDKADSVDITVTCDSAFSVGSNGLLVSIRYNLDGTKSFTWHERYPIATYLVSVTITNFAHFSNWFHYTPSESLEVLNYVLPESLSSAQSLLPNAVDGLKIFSGLFGLYPFIQEKYGHAQFGPGAMEHQTMTSTSTFVEDIIIHELAHQWFGDMITCRTWTDLWLNEGFATYCTALYEGKKYGEQAYRDLMNQHISSARGAVGSVYAHDTSDVRALFNEARVYSKGASTLHMLRHVLGDSMFFASMYAYANDPSLRYRTASTNDFQRICEQTSGKNLNYFFNEWIYGENYPHYRYSWSNGTSSGNRVLSLTVAQTTGTLNPTFFTMPLDLRIVGHGWDSTITIFNDSVQQTYSLAVPSFIDSVQLDPGSWILKDAQVVSSPAAPAEFFLFQNYPNPFNGSTTIRYFLAHQSRISLSLINVLGQRVATLAEGVITMGNYTFDLNAADLASGVYFCRLEGTSIPERFTTFSLVRKLIVLK